MARLRIFGPKARPESTKRNRCENCGRVLLYEGIKLLDYATSVAAGISIYQLGGSGRVSWTGQKLVEIWRCRCGIHTREARKLQ